MHTIRTSSVLGMLLFITACVTINVYFPTAQAVEAADQIIRGVYGEEQAPAAPAEAAVRKMISLILDAIL